MVIEDIVTMFSEYPRFFRNKDVLVLGVKDIYVTEALDKMYKEENCALVGATYYKKDMEKLNRMSEEATFTCLKPHRDSIPEVDTIILILSAIRVGDIDTVIKRCLEKCRHLMILFEEDAMEIEDLSYNGYEPVTSKSYFGFQYNIEIYVGARRYAK